jgi:transcriptional regulator with XRE-family HTH domain
MARRAGIFGKSVHSPAQRAFCAAMIEARRAAGLTQQALAKRLKRHQSFVAKYEAGERRLDVIEFLVITRCLAADPIRILRSLAKELT